MVSETINLDDGTESDEALGPFKLGEPGDRSPWGQVFLAEDSRGNPCQLIVLDPDLSLDRTFASRFVTQHIQVQRVIAHPNSLGYVDVGEVDGRVYLATHVPPGVRMETALNQSPPLWSDRDVLEIALDAAQALKAFARAGMVHGGVHPENCYIDDDGVFTLGPSGMGHWLNGMDGHPVRPPEMAHADYLPERYRNAHTTPDAAVDCYSLGTLLYLLRYGAKPSEGGNYHRQDALGQVIQKSLLDPSRGGYPSAIEMAQDLSVIPTPALRTWRTPLTLGTILLVLILAVVAVVTLDVLPSEIKKSLGFQTHSNDSAATAPQDPEEPATTARTTGQPEAPQASATDPTDAIPAGRETTSSAPKALPSVSKANPDWLPQWADAYGTDQYGPWMAINIAGIPMKFRRFQAGEFTIGSRAGDPGHRHEQEGKPITLSRAFFLSETEVTQEIYEAIMGTNPSVFTDPGKPVESMTWDDAVAFTNKARELTGVTGFRLPTEAEWEWAARAELRGHKDQLTTRIEWQKVAGRKGTRVVADSPAGPEGLKDMHGNVMEWVADSYGPYAQLEAMDPLNRNGISKSVRGGAWTLPDSRSHATTRHHYQPVKKFFFLGFRLAIGE